MKKSSLHFDNFQENTVQFDDFLLLYSFLKARKKVMISPFIECIFSSFLAKNHDKWSKAWLWLLWQTTTEMQLYSRNSIFYYLSSSILPYFWSIF